MFDEARHWKQGDTVKIRDFSYVSYLDRDGCLQWYWGKLDGKYVVVATGLRGLPSVRSCINRHEIEYINDTIIQDMDTGTILFCQGRLLGPIQICSKCGHVTWVEWAFKK
jgi:hypothetical protein